MNTNKIITRENIIYDTPPDMEKLKGLDYDSLKTHTLKLNVSRGVIENINDEDKARIFMINECLRLQPPFPQLVNPVIISENGEDVMNDANTFVLGDDKNPNEEEM